MRTGFIPIALGTVLAVSQGILTSAASATGDASARQAAVPRAGRVQRSIRQPGGQGSLTLEGRIVSPQGRFPRRGEMIRLKGTIQWRNTDPPRHLIVGLRLRDVANPAKPGIIADEDWGKIVSITKRDGGQSGELEWEGEVKANLQGVGGTYDLQVEPLCFPGGRSQDGSYRDEETNQEISLILPWPAPGSRAPGKAARP